MHREDELCLELCPPRTDATQFRPTGHKTSLIERSAYVIDGNQFRRKSLSVPFDKENREWPCKTSIPGSNPGGASNLRSRLRFFRVSYGWQATRRLSSEARSAKETDSTPVQLTAASK